MRQLAMRGPPYTSEERATLLPYCETDVRAILQLLPAMQRDMAQFKMSQCLFRGRYTVAVTRMQKAGIPVDTEMFDAVKENRSAIIAALVDNCTKRLGYPVYDGIQLRHTKLMEWARAEHINWPLTETGRPRTDNETLEDLAKIYPQVQILHECMRTLNVLKNSKLKVWPDGRSRCWLNPFGSDTGRNQPSNSEYLFGMPSWMRHLIKPQEGWGVGYLDFASQELFVAAALSQDPQMIADCLAGNAYLKLAAAAGIAPPDATKTTHPHEYDLGKRCVLGGNYGQMGGGLAHQMGIGEALARRLVELREETYPTFLAWRRRMVNGMTYNTVYRTKLGWPFLTAGCRNKKDGRKNPRKMMNHPIQSAASDLLRVACIAGTEAGIQIVAPVHDAVLIAAPLDLLDQHIAWMTTIMEDASEALFGLRIRAECETVVRWPDRFVPKKGRETWETVLRELERLGALPASVKPLLASTPLPAEPLLASNAPLLNSNPVRVCISTFSMYFLLLMGGLHG
jgi:DNA polymerase I